MAYKSVEERLDAKYLKKKKEEEEKKKSSSSSQETSTKQTTSKTSTTSSNTRGSVEDRLDKKYGTPSENASSVSGWFERATNLAKNFKVGDTSKYTTDYGSAYRSEVSKLKDSSEDVWKYLTSHKNDFDKQTYDGLTKSWGELTNYLSSVGSHIDDVNKYYSQWKNEDAFNSDMMDWLEDDYESTPEKVKARRDKYQSNVDRIAKIKEEIRTLEIKRSEAFKDPNTSMDVVASYDDQIVALEKERENLKVENTEYKRTQGKVDEYYDITQEKNFGDVSAVRDFKNPTEEDLDIYDSDLYNAERWYAENAVYGATMDEDGNVYDAKGNLKFAVNPVAIEDKLGLFLSSSEDDIERATNELSFNTDISNTWANTLNEGILNDWNQLEEGEIGIYYYLLNTKGQEEAYKYLKDMTVELNRRANTEMEKDLSNASALELLAYNVASVPANIIGGVPALIDNISHRVRGEEINPYSKAYSLLNTAQATRSATAEDIVEATGGASFLGMNWGDVYQAGMSGVDSMVGVAMGGSTYGILMGATSASSEMRRLYEEGASSDEIVAGGLLSGAAEMFFEKCSIDHFVKMGNSKTKLDILKNVLKQSGVEASEEAFTSISNAITDLAVRGYTSDVSKSIESYMSQGFSQGEATLKALADVGVDVWKSAVSGFISGGGMSGTVSTANYLGYQAEATKHGRTILNENSVPALKTLADEVSGVTEGKLGKEIGKLSKKVSATDIEGKNKIATAIKNRNNANAIGRLSDMVETARVSQNVADVETALIDKGLSQREAKKAAETIITRIGEKKTNPVFDDKRVAEVYSELVGDVESKLAENINERNIKHTAARLGIDVKNRTVDGKSIERDVSTEGKVAENGKTTQISTGEEIIIDKSNPIAKVETVDGVEKVFFNTDKGAVESTDITYKNEEEALIYESFTDLHPSIASAAIKSYDGTVPVQTYINGMREGILLYGKHNFQAVGKDISVNSNLAQLSSADQALALKLGRELSNIETTKADEALKSALKTATERAEKDITEGKKTARKGKVSYENGAKATNRSQRRAVALAKHLASAIGIDIVFYDSTIKGTYGANANGYYDPDTDTIHLDLQKSVNDSHTIAFTLSHELVHFVKKYSPAKFKVFADFLMEEYAKHGVSTSTLLANKMAELGEDNPDKAYEEMVADACERMLLDSNVMLKLAKLKQIDLDLFEKIRLHIIDILNKIRAEYKQMNYAPQSDEAKALLAMEDVVEKLHEKFEAMVIDATETFQALDTESVKVSEDGTIMMQMKQYETTGRDTLLKYLRQQYGNDNANDLISTMDNLYNAMKEIKEDTALSVFGNWQEQEVELDENGHPIFTTSIKNGDYILNQDFSRVCKKRRQLNFVLNMLAEDPAFEASNLTKDDIVKINKAIKKHGFEIACALCFVDSKRFRQTEWADSFANTWNDILYSVVEDKSKLTPFNFATQNPNINDDGIEIDTRKPVMYRKWSNGKEDVKNRKNHKSFDSMLEKDTKDKYVEGNSNVRNIVKILKNNPHLRHTFRGADIIASDGFDMIQRLAPDIRSILDGWGGTSVPKPSSNDAIYDNSVLNMDGYNAEKAFAIGGVRMNSFSDFMAHMFFDYAQAFADLSAKKLPMHSYTKELDFARLFGLTKGKINMSAIAAIRENATDLSTIKGRANKDAMTKWEKSIAGLDISKLADKLGKAETDITYDDVIKNLDDCEYVWADESIDVQSATLLQSGIMYDNLSKGKAAYCYELIKEGKFDEAFKIAGEENVNREYAKHLGIITVGVSKAHILKLMRDPTIRMVIPYHKSGLNSEVAKALKILFYEDFTDVQNTMLQNADGKTVGLSKDGAKINGKNIRDFNFYDYFGKTIDGVFYDGKATASKYLEWCEKGEYNAETGEYGYFLTDGTFVTKAEVDSKGLEIIPKFAEFAEEENYYKVIEDFDCYDTITGEHSSQEAVDFLRDDGLPADYKNVLKRALKAEQEVSDEFRDHLDNQGLRDEIMDIVGANGYTPSNIKKQAKKRYWRPDMTPAEVAEVNRLTKNELFKNDQYIDNGIKWLYNTSKGSTYFALYSTANEENPTILYCSKEKEAMEDANYISDVLKRRGITKDGNELRRRIADRLSVLLGDEYSKGLVDNVGTAHDGISDRIATLYKSKPRSRPRRALQNCLENVAKTQGNKRDEINSHKSQPKFQMKQPIETVKDLVAMHNISVQNLIDALDRQGLPMPSLAVTNKGLVDFGEISLLFDKRVIDPAENSENKLFGSDAWTPGLTYLKMNAKFDVAKTENFVNTMKSNIGEKYVSELLNINAQQFQDAIKEADGNIHEAYQNNIGVQTAYAMEQGIISKIPTKKNGTVDKVSLVKQVDRVLDTDNGWRQYRMWLKNISDSIITDYDAATNDDILRHMKAQPESAKPFKLSKKGDLVVPAVKYNSIEDLRKNKNRLSNNANEEAKAVGKEFIAFAKSLGGNIESVVGAINASFKDRYSVADIVRSFKAKGITIPTNTAKELQSLYKKAVELPTQYFEAKPGGTVGLNEIRAAVIPNNAPAELKKRLADNGIEVIEYDGTNESRLEAVNSVEDIKFQKKRNTSYAPTFYSKMERVIDDIKINKMGAGGVVSYLKGKGVKNEEIKWSGIETFLEGKKSLTKEELQEFVKGSQLQIEEKLNEGSASITIKPSVYGGWDVMRGGEILDTYSWNEDSELYESDTTGGGFSTTDRILEYFKEKYGSGDTRWGEYKLDGGSNYREILFTMPNSTYSNASMRVHWGEDVEGVLAHARIQDLETTDGKKMLFVEEIQSDWHNAGHKEGYRKLGQKTAWEINKESQEAYREFYNTVAKMFDGRGYSYNPVLMANLFEGEESAYRFLDRHEIVLTEDEKKYIEKASSEEAKRKKDLEQAPKSSAVPEAPFRKNYHEYVLKRLVRMVAEEGYDSIGWTTADIQMDRWNPQRQTNRQMGITDAKNPNAIAFERGYQIEYDEGIKSYLEGFGEKLGAKVGKADVQTKQVSAKEEANILMAADILEDGDSYIREQMGIKEVWSMDITDSMKNSVLYEGQPKFQKKKPTNRELLSNALESTIDDSTIEGKLQSNVIERYKESIAKVEELETHLAEVKKEIYELSFRKGSKDMARLRELREDKVMTENRINTYDRRLLEIEATKPMKDLLKREKEMVRKRYEEEGRVRVKKALNKKNESLAFKKERENLQKLILSTAKWLESPGKNDVKCPDILRKPFADFLASIDTSSKRLLKGGEATKNDYKFAMAMDSLATAVDRIKAAQDPSAKADGENKSTVELGGYLDLPENFAENIRIQAEGIKSFIDMASDGDNIINDMSSDELKELSKIIKILKKGITEMQTLYTNYRFANAQALGRNTMEYADSLGESKDSTKLKDFAMWDNTVPYYAFKRFGEGGESIFESLMDSQDKLAFHADEILKFKEKNWSDKEVSAWSNDTHTINLPSGRKITLTTADAMSIYCLSRRFQGKQHLVQGGVRVVGLTNKFGKKSPDVKANLVTEDVDAIGASLTDRQKEVAQKMQEFMSTRCAEWGNEIWMKRFLTTMFNEKNYFPIESDPNVMDYKDPTAKQSDMFRLLNISATKPLTEGANNRVVIRNIFDVFSAHSSDMARLNAYGMSLLDYMKWINYREKSTNVDTGEIDVKGVRNSLDSAYGSGAMKYITTLIKDINGSGDVAKDNAFAMQLMRGSKTAAVGANLRVAMLQFTALPRAALVISPKNITKGLGKKPSIAKAQKYCGMALWKSFGFYDTNIGKNIESQIKGDRTVTDKIIEASLKGAELGDKITWGYLWNACEYEVAATKKYKVGTEEFNRAVAEKLREVIYASQVVDSTLTRSQMMRNRSGLNQMLSAFMSEPTLTYNAWLNALSQFNNEKRRTRSAKSAWKNTKGLVTRSISTIMVTSLVVSIAEALADAFRDDEDEPFGEKFINGIWGGFITNMNPLNKIPVASDIMGLIEAKLGIGYFSSDRLDTQYLTTLSNAYDAWVDIIKKGEDAENTLYYAIYNTTKAASQLTGLPISNAMREVVSLWNNTAGAYDSTLKLRNYDLSNEKLGNELYEAIVEGNDRQAESLKLQFGDEDAVNNALIKAIRENNTDVVATASDYINGDLTAYKAMVDELVAQGFDEEVAAKAIKSVVSMVGTTAQYEANGDTDAYNENVDKLVALGYDEDQLLKDIDSLEKTPNDTDKATSIYKNDDYVTAMISGNTTMAATIKADLIDTMMKNGKTEEEAEESLSNALNRQYKIEYVEGRMSDSEVTAWVKERSDSKDTDADIYWKVKEWKARAENMDVEDYSYSKYADFHQAILDGDTRTMNAFILECRQHTNRTSNKEVASDIASAITSHFKPIYKEASSVERVNLKAKLLNAYAQLGYARSNRSKLIDKWLED